MRFLTAFLCVNLTLFGFSQEKKIIDHTVYNDWNSLKSAEMSNDGRYISYEITPHRGDGVLCIYNTVTKVTDTIPRATNASFSGGNSYIAFKITPDFDTLRTLELDKVKKSKWPEDTLGIYLFANDTLMKFAKLNSFSVNDENDWMSVEFKHNDAKTTEVKKKRCFLFGKKKDDAPEFESSGHVLWMFHPENQEARFNDMSDFVMSDEGNFVAFTTQRKYDKVDSIQLHVFKTEDQSLWSDSNKYASLLKIKFNNQENQLVYLASSDSAEVKSYDLMLVGTDGNPIASINSETAGVDTMHSISKNFSPFFTLNDDILYFGIGDREFKEPKDTLLDDEKVNLDLWHHADDRLQPQQLKELRRDKMRSSLFVYHLNDGTIVQLEDDTLSIRPESNLKGDYLLGTSEEQYAHTYNWVSPRPQDYYRVNIKTGERQLLKAGQKFGLNLSPSGSKMMYFEDGNFHFSQADGSNKTCVTCETQDVVWTDDMNGMPMEAYPRGGTDWNRDETKAFLQSEFDIWQFNTQNDSLTSYTHDLGKINNIRLTYSMWEYDSVYFEAENLRFSGFNQTTKGEHFYSLKEHEDHFDLVEEANFDANVYGLDRSKDGSRYFFRKMTFEDYPEVYTFTDAMQNAEKISETNPQQEEYNWGTVELTNWTSYDGIELEGLLYKPADFDSTKSYPLMVYFYELYSDRLHTHYIPKPTASIVYATEYTSAGYVFFIPDIRYEPGHPAKSAYDCIMSGTDHVLDILPNVDSNRMALQGQSWGGYQTAQLVTMTDRYAAAMAGAPVANMFSAYGGIRWGSGYNRQFQYERTQSRIGYTIWEQPDLYFENSPLFGLPNVSTPLMIMHNDGDGAVPWYQGIELFTGLKRLDKTAWLLNYNDDDHNLMRNANRIDLSIRMRQFFDHYLLDAPAPKWLTDGIPATVKGKELRYGID